MKISEYIFKIPIYVGFAYYDYLVAPDVLRVNSHTKQESNILYKIER